MAKLTTIFSSCTSSLCPPVFVALPVAGALRPGLTKRDDVLRSLVTGQAVE